MDTSREPYTLNGGESVSLESQLIELNERCHALGKRLALLHGDTQERAERVIETGIAAARYVIAASACAAIARKERAYIEGMRNTEHATRYSATQLRDLFPDWNDGAGGTEAHVHGIGRYSIEGRLFFNGHGPLIRDEDIARAIKGNVPMSKRLK